MIQNLTLNDEFPLDPHETAVLWSLELASEFFHDIFAYDFDGEESRPSDLQTVVGTIPRRARSRLGGNFRKRA